MSVYQGKSGQWAFFAHRITGFLVVLFLLMHIVDVSLIGIDRDLYNRVHDLYGNVFMRLFEVGLLAALLFHAFNGLRIIAIDFFPAALRVEKSLLTVVLLLTLVGTVLGGYVIMLPFIEGRLS